MQTKSIKKLMQQNLRRRMADKVFQQDECGKSFWCVIFESIESESSAAKYKLLVYISFLLAEKNIRNRIWVL